MLKIETLTMQHQELTGLIESIRRALAKGDAQAAAADLGRFGTALTAHLALEDAQLYPALREAGQKPDAPLALMTNIKMFFDEMEGLKPVVVGFLGKWNATAIAADFAGFKKEFDGIAQAFSARAAREEARLYSLYVEHCLAATAG